MKGRRLPLGVSPRRGATTSEEKTAKRASSRGTSPVPPSRRAKTAKSPVVKDAPKRASRSAPPPIDENGGGDVKPGSNPKPLRSYSKRGSDGDLSINSRTRCFEVLPTLQASLPDGSSTNIKLLVGGEHFAPIRDTEGERLIHDSTDIGQDGNQFYCQVCHGFGEIVCCDGCPKVYHHDCIPTDDPSRQSLDRDDDPWYCPECIKTKQATEPIVKAQVEAPPASEKSDSSRRSSQHRCADCNQPRDDLELDPCQDCGNYVHHPSCLDATNHGVDEDKVFCSTCWAVRRLEAEEQEEASDAVEETIEEDDPNKADDDANEDDEDEEMEDTKEEEQDGAGEGEENGDDGTGDAVQPESSNGVDNVHDDPATPPRRKRRARSDSVSKESSGKKRKKKEKKKMKRRKMSKDLSEPSPSPVPPSVAGEIPLFPTPGPGIAQAIPAFYFYLGENRWKIERALARNHRTFNRLPKGSERNALVAKEAAIWWSKLRPSEHRRYINMSMRDYESRIIEWKEDKNLMEMGLADESGADVQGPTRDETLEDERLTYERHERLFLSTSVGSKPFKPEPDQSYNRVLLDLLHDMRFHPLPMLHVNRSENETVIDDHNAKVTIPHFEVHGPVATSVGDECLGCSRGWLHFCPVLQRRVPAVEHRAKLQPPLSSWVATRVGLGLRPRFDREDGEEYRAEHGQTFAWRDSGEWQDLRNLPVVLSNTLSHPSERADDVAHFIEETMAMKVPEPPRPLPPGSSPSNGSSARKLPVQRAKDATVDEQETPVYKCGRCRTIIYNDTGCVQCRRAQLVINTTKQQNTEQKGILNVKTVMLGRVNVKDGIAEAQSEGDLAVSQAMLKERWSPNAILPPGLTAFPVSRPQGTAEDDIVSDRVEKSKVVDMEIEEPAQSPIGSAEDETEGRSRRSNRAAAADEVDRDSLAKDNKRKTDELNKKILSIACCSILLAMRRRDPLLLFAEPVTADGYADVVKRPIDLGMIRSDVLAGKYSSLGAFVSDARRLCENAVEFNPAGSIWAKTAKELYDLLAVMQKRASNWMGAIMDAYTSFLYHEETRSDGDESVDPFASLRDKWPDAVEMMESGDWIKNQLAADFMRTQENETAYYGSMAIRRIAAAAEASLASYTDSGGVHSIISKRSHKEDETLRRHIDERVASLTQPLQLRDVSTWREEAVVRLMRKVQSRRLDRRSSSENGCSRCDSMASIQETLKASNVDFAHPGKGKRKGDGDVPRVHASRVYLTTGLGSAKTCQKIVKRQEDPHPEDSLSLVCVSVRGSKIHGWGLFADQPFKKGDVVAEYIGEYVPNDVADRREKAYQEQRIQDYQFRLDDKLVIDATMKGGHGRYINHNCSPNCYAKMIPGKEHKPHLKRVLIIAQRQIEINEEITYDYQFPLELNLDNRIPCNCQSDACRGFMNWDIPEKGSNNRALLVQKRGANMRDRIRRLGRPLKRDEV